MIGGENAQPSMWLCARCIYSRLSRPRRWVSVWWHRDDREQKKQLLLMVSHNLPEAETCSGPSFTPFCLLVSKYERLHTVVLLVFGLHMKFQLTVEPKCYLGAETGMSYKGGRRREHSHRGQAVLCLITLILCSSLFLTI